MGDAVSPLPLSGLTAGREALLEANEPGYIERSNVAHLLSTQGLFRLMKQIMTVNAHTVEMNGHFYANELEALGFKRLDLVTHLELDAMVAQVKVEYGTGRFATDYSGFINRLKQSRAHRGTHASMVGQIQEALVKTDPRLVDAAGRHVREQRVYIFDQALTSATWTGFASRKPFFHAMNGTLAPFNFHKVIATTVRFTGVDAGVWPSTATGTAAPTFAVGCHEVSYWLKRRRHHPVPAQDPDTERLVRCDVSHCFQGILGNARDINYHNLTKEAPNVNKFTRFFCVCAMASIVADAQGASQEQAVEELEEAITGEVDPLNVGIIPNPSARVAGRMTIAQEACRMVHDPLCQFWQTEWGEIPENVGRILWGQPNPPRGGAAYRGGGEGRGRGRGRGRGVV